MNANQCAFRGAIFLWSVPMALLCGVLCTPLTSFGQSAAGKVLKEVAVTEQTVTQQTLLPSQKISALDFTRYAANTVADAIRNLSGVNIKDYGGIGGLKTVSVRSLGANHTGVFYDGIQLNDAQNGQVDLGKLALNNLADIVLYNGQPERLLLPARAYASASVLMINPAQPAVSPIKPLHIVAGVKAGSFGLFEPLLQVEQLISTGWAYKVNIFNTHANGAYAYKVEGDGSTGAATRSNSDIGALQTEAAVYYSAKDSSTFNLRINYYKSERGLPGAVVFYNDYSSQRLWNEDLSLQSKYQKKWQHNLQLLLNTKLSKAYTRYLDPDFLNTAGELDQRYQQKEYYLSAALAYQPIQKLEVSYAADAAITELSTNLYQYVYPQRLTLQQVLAGKYQQGRSVFQANILHTYITESVFRGAAAPSRSVFSPTLGYSVQPFKNRSLQIRTFYKSVFRNPTFNDLYYSRIGAVNLKPEYVQQYNLGLTSASVYQGRFSYLTLTADAYYNKVKDKIIAVPNKDIFSWTMRNLGEVDIRGLDVSAKTKYQLTSKWAALLAVNYTYQDAVDVTDRTSSVYLNQIPYTPKHTTAINVGLSHKNGGIYYNHLVSAQRYYLGENLPEYRVPGFAVADLSFSCLFKCYGLPINSSLAINNIYNQQYALIRSFPMPGRSYRVSINVTL